MIIISFSFHCISNVNNWPNGEGVRLIEQSMYVRILSLKKTCACSCMSVTYASFFGHSNILLHLPIILRLHAFFKLSRLTGYLTNNWMIQFNFKKMIFSSIKLTLLTFDEEKTSLANIDLVAFHLINDAKNGLLIAYNLFSNLSFE
jgi:hypothetical protein